MTELRQSTAATVPIGPIVDSTDGATPETGFTISQADIRLSKNGGAFAQSNNAAGAAHMENGWFGAPLNTTDTNTLGELVVNIAESGGLQAWARFMVVSQSYYDAKYGTGNFPADAKAISGDTTAADNLEAMLDGTGGVTFSATLTGPLNALAANTLTAAAADPGLTTELQAGLATSAALATTDVKVDAIKAKTDGLPSDPADASDITGAFGVVNGSLATIAGYLDTEIAAIKTVTDALPNGGALTSLATAAAIAALNNISTASILAAGDIDGFTIEQALKLILANAAGKLSGAATATNTIRAADDSKARITATVDADGNRSVVTLDATG